MTAASFLFQPNLAKRVGSDWVRVAYALGVVYPVAWLDYARSRKLFRDVDTFVAFIGHPRSGHTLAGALLNAHRHALIAHELNAARYLELGFRGPQIMALLRRRDEWFRDRNWMNEGYSYAVPGGHHGMHDDLKVIGDKKAGGTTWALIRHPNLLDTMRDRMGKRLRIFHHVRNPYDNIATVARREGRGLGEAVDRFRHMMVAVDRAANALRDGELLRQWHEDFVLDVEGHMTNMCAFVGLEPDPAYLAACRAVVFESPKLSRDTAAWTDEMVDKVEAICREFPCLNRYAGSPVTLAATG